MMSMMPTCRRCSQVLLVLVVITERSVSWGRHQWTTSSPRGTPCSSDWSITSSDRISVGVSQAEDVRHCPELNNTIAYGIFIGVELLEEQCRGNKLYQTFSPKYIRCRFLDNDYEVYPKGIYPVIISPTSRVYGQCVSSAAFEDEMDADDLRHDPLRRACGNCIDKQVKSFLKTC